MNRGTGHHRKRQLVQRRAVHMIEVAVSMIIVSVILLTAMNMVGAAGQSTRSMTDPTSRASLRSAASARTVSPDGP